MSSTYDNIKHLTYTAHVAQAAVQLYKATEELNRAALELAADMDREADQDVIESVSAVSRWAVLLPFTADTLERAAETFYRLGVDDQEMADLGHTRENLE